MTRDRTIEAILASSWANASAMAHATCADGQ